VLVQATADLPVFENPPPPLWRVVRVRTHPPDGCEHSPHKLRFELLGHIFNILWWPAGDIHPEAQTH